MTLDDAIKQLQKEYEHAKTLNHVNNPLAYALYHVWRIADSKKERERK